MTEPKMRVEGMTGCAAPPFHPILTDAGSGPTFTMLGTTMRLIATASGTGGRYAVIEQGIRHWLEQRNMQGFPNGLEQRTNCRRQRF